MFIFALLGLGINSSGQNKWGFETMVNTLLSGKVDTTNSNKLKIRMRENPPVLLDTRSREEFAVSHIKGAIHVGYEDFDVSSVAGLSRDTALVVYCSVGKRSEEIGIKLKELGFKNVENLFGGIFDWTNRGFEVVDTKGKTVTEVHPYNAVWGIWVNNYKKSYGTK